MVLHILHGFQGNLQTTPITASFPNTAKFSPVRPVSRLPSLLWAFVCPCSYSCFSLSGKPSSFNGFLIPPHFEVWPSPSTFLTVDLVDFPYWTVTTDQRFSTFSSHGTHELLTVILRHINNILYFLLIDKSRYNFYSFMLDGYCGIDCCHFLICQSKERAVSAPD